LRAAALLDMAGSRLPEGVRRRALVLLGADPLPVVRARAFAALLQGPGAEQVLPVVRFMLGESAAGAKSKQQQDQGRVGSAAASVAAPVALEDLSDRALLRLLDDVTDAFHRRGAPAAGEGGEAGAGAGAEGADEAGPGIQASLGGGGGGGGGDAALLNHPLLSIPLANSDPLNVRYRRSNAFYTLCLRAYGIDRGDSSQRGGGDGEAEEEAALWQQKTKDAYAAFQQLTGSPAEHAAAAATAATAGTDDPASASSSPTLLERLSPSARAHLLAEVRARQLAHLEPSPLLASFIRRDAGGHAAALLDELLRRFESLRPESADGAGDEAGAAPKPQGAKPAEAGIDFDADAGVDIDMGSKLHTLSVALNILQALCYSASPAASCLPGSGAVSASERAALASKLSGALAALQRCGGRFAAHARHLRSRVLSAVSDLAAFRGPGAGTRWHVPARDQRDWERREHYQRTVMALDETGSPAPAPAAVPGADGAPDAAAVGGPDPVTGLPRTKAGLLEHAQAVERSVAGWNAQLAHTTVLQTHVVRSVAQLLVLRQAQPPATAALQQGLSGNGSSSEAQIDPATAAQSLLWLGAMFADQHRGVRRAVREAMVATVAARCALAAPAAPGDTAKSQGSASARATGVTAVDEKSPFALLVQRTIGVLYRALKDKTAPLLDGGAGSSGPQPSGGGAWMRRRPRADLVHLLAQLLPYATQALVRADVLELLVALWDDSDPAVRAAAVSSVRRLLAAKQRLPEVAAFAAPADALKSAPLVRAILTRVRDPNYA
jgi:hypothetical protein